MSDGCIVGQNNIETLIASDKANETAIEDTKFLANPDFDLVEIILKDMGKRKGDTITEDEMNDAFKEMYNQKYGKVYKTDPETGLKKWTGEIKDTTYLLGGKASVTSILLAGKITALLQSNPHLYSVFEPYIIKRIPEKVLVSTGPSGIIHLGVLPVPTLKNIYGQLHGMINNYSQGQDAHGSFKGVIVKFGKYVSEPFVTPGQMIYKDPSGGLSLIQKATRDYPDLVASNIATFTSNPEFLPDDIKLQIYATGKGKKVSELSALEIKKAKTRKLRGMNAILGDLKKLGTDNIFTDSNAPDRMTNLFTMLMRGEVSLEHLLKGELMIHKDYGVLRDENGKIRRYDRKGTEIRGVPIKGFKNLEPLKTHTPTNQKKGAYYLPLTDGSKGSMNMFKRIGELAREARIIDNAAFLYVQKETGKSVQQLMGNLQKNLKLDEGQINTLFFHQGTKNHGTLVKYLKSSEPEAYRLYNLYNDTFGTLVSQEQIITNGGVYDLEAPTYRRDHWPTLYQKDTLRVMLDQKSSELQPEVKALEEKGIILKSLRQLYKKGTEEEWEYYNKLGQLNSIEAIRDNMDNYHVDLNHNTLIPFASDNKHFKRLSTAYDIRAGRRDDGIYYDYLKNMMSTVQRNYMASSLVEALARIDKSKRIPESEKEGLVNYTVNLFKVPFHSATVKGLFGWSNEGVSRFIKKTVGRGRFFRHFNPQYVTSKFKAIASKTSALFLPGIFTSPITNLTGQFQSINDFGIRLHYRAMQRYKNPDTKEAVERLISQSGITEFSDFFSMSMVSGIVKVQLEQDAHFKILREQLIYHRRLKRAGLEWIVKEDLSGHIISGKNTKKAEEIKEAFIKNVSSILSQSESHIKAEDIKIQEKGRVKARKKQLKLEMRVTNANELLQFSIEKNFEYKKLIKVPGMMNLMRHSFEWSAQGLWQGYSTVIKFMAKNMFGKEFTMSDSEKYVRSVSFIIGVQRAHDSGLLDRSKHWWEYTNKDDIEKAINVGKEFSYFSNFGMSTQAVGPYNYNGVGNMIGKFKYWSQQKAGRDLRIFKEAYRSLKSEEKIEGRGKDKWYKFKHFDSKAVGELIGILFRFKGGKFDVGRHYQRRLRATHGEVAALRTFLTTQVFMTFLWDMALGGPLRFLQYVPVLGPTIQFAKQWMYQAGAGGQIKNTTSDVVSLMMFPFLLSLKIALWGIDDSGGDDDDDDRILSYYLRRIPFLGYLPMVTFDRILALYYQNTMEEGEAARSIVHAWKGKLGGQFPGIKPAHGLLESLIKMRSDY